MRSPVVIIKEGLEIKEQTKTEIGLGSVIMDKVDELEKITREGRSSRLRKEVVGCIYRVVGKKTLLFQF